jgi:hypothetical protein
VTVTIHLPEEAALELSQEYLSQVGFDQGLETQPLSERGRRLLGSSERRRVDGGNRLVGQSRCHQSSLMMTEFGEVRVTVTVDQGEGFAGNIRH